MTQAEEENQNEKMKHGNEFENFLTQSTVLTLCATLFCCRRFSSLERPLFNYCSIVTSTADMSIAEAPNQHIFHDTGTILGFEISPKDLKQAEWFPKSDVIPLTQHLHLHNVYKLRQATCESRLIRV